eukprot:gnl/Dysnectes_brevis/212_a242_9094.p2 GENE.gnl/Dysnectes_brevis/212_a242_9094~~gnl/Dysnectes_brevis/212_a242_9094.p2  ORF type:complete len:155 (-),score=47.76 gnl/Dysnectes_brevis/212_a242_9094:69-533(-)
MGRLHSNGKGISKSSIPYVRAAPSWSTITPEEICGHVCKLAKKGTPPSKIGVILRDQYGVGQISHVTNSKIVRVLKANGLAPEIPEDLYCLIKKAVAVRRHLERNRRDKDAKFRLILTESRIHRLVRYYRRTRRVPPAFRYKGDQAAALLTSFA